MTGSGWLRRSTNGAGCDGIALLRGTRIRTPQGDVPVEQLAPGSRVLGGSGALRHVARIAMRKLDLSRHPAPASVRPIRFRRSAIDSQLPARDLCVSRDLAVRVGDRLFPAQFLANGATILADAAIGEIDYFQVELDAPDLLLAEGLPVASAGPPAARSAFPPAGALLLHPHFSLPYPEAPDAVLAAVRTRLLQRAMRLGHALTCDADAHLLVNGQPVRPAQVKGTLHRFAIPSALAPVRDLRLLSRAAVPAEIEPGATDRRRLGLKLERLVLRADWLWINFSAAEPALREGFHAAERGEGVTWRWTDGHARLPILPGLVRVDLHVLGSQPAWTTAALPAAPGNRSA